MPLHCTAVEFQLLGGLVMSSRGKRAMEARGLFTAHLGVRLPTPQEGATGVSMLRGDYKARGARGLLPDQPRVQPSLGTYGDPAHAHAAISLVGAMHAAGVPAAVRNAWLGAAGSGSLKEIFSGLEAEAEAEAGEVSGVAEAGEPVDAEGGAGEADGVIEAGEAEPGAEAPPFNLDGEAYPDVAEVQAVSPTSSPSPKPNPIARPQLHPLPQPQTQLSVPRITSGRRLRAASATRGPTTHPRALPSSCRQPAPRREFRRRRAFSPLFVLRVLSQHKTLAATGPTSHQPGARAKESNG